MQKDSNSGVYTLPSCSQWDRGKEGLTTPSSQFLSAHILPTIANCSALFGFPVSVHQGEKREPHFYQAGWELGTS